MSQLEPCELHEVTNCAICTGLDETQRRAERGHRAVAAAWVVAQWSGRCADCGEWFDSGEGIRYSDAHHGWVGTCCG